MQEYLDDSRLTNQARWIGYYRIHCVRDFWAAIRDKLREDKVAPVTVMTHPFKFQEYVCFRFTRTTYPKEVMRRLLSLEGKGMEPTPAWKAVAKLVYCYNEYMRRRRGSSISDQQHIQHFAHALKRPVSMYIMDLLQQRHPSVKTARKAYEVALEYVRDRQPTRGERRRGRRD